MGTAGSAPELLCGRESFFDSHGLLCRRTCGVDDLNSELPSCDPAGAVFDDTLRNVPSSLNRAAFHFAGASNLAALRWLFVFGASVDVVDSQGTTLLHVACRTGGLQIVKDIVRRGLSVNVQDSVGWTPLHVASCMGRQDVSLYLLHQGAKTGLRNSRGQTAEQLCSQPFTKEVVVSYEHARSSRPRQALDNFGEEQFGGLKGIGSSLHFEPFFVPRESVIQEPRYRQELQNIGTKIFNKSAGHGVAFLVAAEAVRDYPVEINNFLIQSGADSANFGGFLGEEYPIAQTLRLEYLNSLPLVGTGVVSALETAFHDVSVPDDWLKTDRLTRGVAHFWWRQHAEELMDDASCRPPEGRNANIRDHTVEQGRGELSGLDLQRCLLGTDALHRLMFSTLMLYQWLKAGQTMSLNEWTQLNMGIETNGSDIPMHVQTAIYKVVIESDLRFGRNAREVLERKPLDAMALTIDGCANVRYSGRAHIGTGSDAAAWTDATPRLLAAAGGVLSAGRAGDVPRFGHGGMSTLPRPSGAANGKIREEMWRPADHPNGYARGHSALSRDLPLAMSSMSRPLDSLATGSGIGGTGCQAEAAWLSLHGWMLLLSTATEDNTTYAFVSLRHAMIREADPHAGRLVITSRPEATWPPLVHNEDGWLDLCLLLSDGRFQAMEAPELEIRFSRQSDFAAWRKQLEEICKEPPPPGAALMAQAGKTLKLPSLAPKDLKLPDILLDDSMTDDILVPAVPLLPGEERSRGGKKDKGGGF
eukprot:TRINITY_DN10486_c0_g1_i2.p1 TRINITY_DN10486_c0_g1~~TRINITY_DN10486_c0_g1_i2.p1  ORF type:complete len:758 (+),score=162.32 TRINITY_DN10486_c0_g1_i2:181-2454(+)